MIDWAAVYRFAIPLLAASYVIQTIVFLALRPRCRIEWTTVAASVSIGVFFTVLSYWLAAPTTVRPNIYPPLVVAATVATIVTVIFTVFVTKSWIVKRKV